MHQLRHRVHKGKHEFRIRAERRVGELIQAQKATVGLNPGTRIKGGNSRAGGSIQAPPDRPTLSDASIDKDRTESRARI
jgi:hypothetical protein